MTVPPAALEAFAREVEAQRALGRPVTVSLRVVLVPSRKRLAWRVVLDEMALASGDVEMPGQDRSISD